MIIDHQMIDITVIKMTTRSIETTFYDVIFFMLINETINCKYKCIFMIEKTLMRKYLSL